MPPHSRTQPPARRPRVAGLRDPRRLQESEATTEGPVEGSAESGADAALAPSTRPTPSEAPDDTGARNATRTADPAAGGATRAGGAATASSPVSLAKAPVREDHDESGPVETTPSAAPTRTAKPTPTGRARTTRRRPAPATGSARTEPGRGRRAKGRTRRGAPRWLVPALAVAVVVLLVAAGLAFFLGYSAWSSPARSNTAVVDPAATAEAAGATRQAMEQLFSYDPAKLDDSVNAARDLGTGDFTRQYVEVFDRSTRPNAQQQGLKQTASVLDLGVRSIDGDDANVIVLVQFDVARASTGQSATTPGLLSADMHRDGGRWKVARIVPLTGQG